MAGGRGSRMGGRAKLTALHEGRESVLRVADALAGSGRMDGVAAAVSAHAPRARALLESRGVRTLATRGLGYPLDMAEAISRLGAPAMVVPGDMALMDAGAVRRILELAGTAAGWASVVYGISYARSLGLEPGPPAPGGRAYSGISVAGAAPSGPAAESLVEFNDARAVFNINRPGDLGLLGAARRGAAEAAARAGGP